MKECDNSTRKIHVSSNNMKYVCVKVLGILVFSMDGLSPELEVFISARQTLCGTSTLAHLLQHTGVTI
jgi:hypothetical protein